MLEESIWRLISNLQYDKNTVCEICKKTLLEKEGSENSDEGTVVCPICGAPYHKSCYKEKSGCIYEVKHGTEFDYYHKINNNKENEVNKKEGGIACKNCLYVNSKDENVCKNCGEKLDKPFSRFVKVINFDLINSSKEDLRKKVLSQVGLISEEDSEKEIDGISLGDLAKFTLVNSEYYVNIFKKIKKKNKSRFNFCAFWFPAAWFLYRKQYKLGISLLVLSCIVSVVTAFIKFKYLGNITKVLFGESTMYASKNLNVLNYLNVSENFNKLSLSQQLLFFIPSICELLTILIMILSGIFANRIYLRHCVNKIKNIKNNVKTSLEYNYDDVLLKEGGVSTKAVSLTFLCYIISQYLPLFFMK